MRRITSFVNDESGFVISSELMILATLIIGAAIAGGAAIRDSLVLELEDVAESVGAVSQSYNLRGIRKPANNGSYHGSCSGFGFNDNQDDCDCTGVTFAAVCGKPSSGTDGT